MKIKIIKINKTKLIKHIVSLSLLLFILILPFFVFANPLEPMQDVADRGGFDTGSADETRLAEVLGLTIKSFLGLLGVIFIILILYGGYNWMIAGGNEQTIEKAKQIITRAVIGLIIVLGSYAIWEFIFFKLIL